MKLIIFILLTLTCYVESKIVSVLGLDNLEFFWYDYDTANLRPTKVSSSDVLYYLYTNRSPTDPAIITNGDVDQLENSTFNPENDILVICHGWMGNYTTIPGPETVTALFGTNHTLNILLIDWNAKAKELYPVAREAVAGVGREVGLFLGRIQRRYGVGDEQIALVGHSLGAHVVGAAGKWLRGRARYIIGLDPARPLFPLHGWDTIGSADAKYVQIIHSDAGNVGIDGELGDADFYPNGGANQTGCSNTPESPCDHVRAAYYYIESLSDDEVFVGTRCRSYRKYLANKCKYGRKARMGTLNPDRRAFGRYYLKTNSQSPFAEN